MTIKIEIEAHPDRGDMRDQVDNAMKALGFSRQGAYIAEWRTVAKDELQQAEEILNEQRPEPEAQSVEEPATEPTSARDEHKPSLDDIDTRLVGEPADGNKRRNSEQKAEDDEFEALAVKAGLSLEKVNAGIQEAGRAEAMKALKDRVDHVADEKPAISTGEERVGPEDDAATQAQDKADEDAEAAAKSDGSVTHDDLRRALGAYQKVHGMKAAVAAVAEGGLIGCTVDKVAADDLPAMIAQVEKATADAPAKTEEPAPAETKAAEPEAKPATRDDLLGAMKAYARKFDGTDTDQSKMTATMADMPKIFQKVFGPGIEKQSQVPDARLGEAVAAVRAAVDENPFKREAK